MILFILILAALVLIIVGRDKIKNAFIAFISDAKYPQSGQIKSTNSPEKNKIGEIGLTMALLGLACVVVYFCIQSVYSGDGWGLLAWALSLGVPGFFLGIFGMILSLIGVFKAPRKSAITGLCISPTPILFIVIVWISA